jgi:hypothetical protein
MVWSRQHQELHSITDTLTQAQLFDSPSTAAGVILGRTANGRIEWRNASGQTLKEMQEAALQETSSPNSAGV